MKKTFFMLLSTLIISILIINSVNSATKVRINTTLDDDVNGAVTGSTLYVDDVTSGSWGDAAFLYNLSSIPGGATITDVTHYIYVISRKTIVDTSVIGVWGNTNTTWATASTILRTTGTNFMNFSGDKVWNTTTTGINVTSWISQRFSLGETMITLDYYTQNMTSGDEYFTIASMDMATASQRPYINITYEVSDPCVYSGSGDFVVSSHCNLVGVSYNVCPNIVNITSSGWINLSGNGVLNASKIVWSPRDVDEYFRLRWYVGSKVRWGSC